jgi:hypothetical protein
MKTRILALIGLSLVEACSKALAQTCNVTGFVDATYKLGYNLISNPLQTTNHHLSVLFGNAPDGTTLWLWDPGSRTFDPISTYLTGQGWTADFAFDPGQGALLYAPVAFTNTFVGVIMEPDGSPFCPDGPFILPAPFAGPTGAYLLSSKLAATLSGSNAFQLILGREVQEGEQFTWLDAATQTYHTTMFLRGVWSNGEPMLPVGTSAFFYIYAYAYAAPSLQILPLNSNVVLSWPISAPDFVLETSSNLYSGAIWMPLTNGIATNLVNFVLTNSAKAAKAFYRLQKR